MIEIRIRANQDNLEPTFRRVHRLIADGVGLAAGRFEDGSEFSIGDPPPSARAPADPIREPAAVPKPDRRIVRVSSWPAVWAQLQGKTLTIDQVVKKTGSKRGRASNAMADAVEKGLAVRVARGAIRILDKTPSQPSG